MDMLNKSIENFDPNAKIGEIFLVDIEFDAYDYPRKRETGVVFSSYSRP